MNPLFLSKNWFQKYIIVQNSGMFYVNVAVIELQNFWIILSHLYGMNRWLCNLVCQKVKSLNRVTKPTHSDSWGVCLWYRLERVRSIARRGNNNTFVNIQINGVIGRRCRLRSWSIYNLFIIFDFLYLFIGRVQYNPIVCIENWKYKFMKLSIAIQHIYFRIGFFHYHILWWKLGRLDWNSSKNNLQLV